MSSPRRATFADLAALGEDTRCEIVHGEVLPKAMPRAEHGNSQLAAASWLRRRFDRPAGGRWPGGWWLGTEIHIEYETHEVYCHDVVGWRRDRVAERPRGWPVRTRPDWVCEVLSPGHEKRDLVDKLWTLMRAGVPHYWVIDREAALLSIYRLTPTGYLMLPPVAAGVVTRAEPFDAVELATSMIFGDEPDED